MADYNSIRSRQESTDESLEENSNSSAVSTEDVYSDIDEEKDGFDIDDFQMIKTIVSLNLHDEVNMVMAMLERYKGENYTGCKFTFINSGFQQKTLIVDHSVYITSDKLLLTAFQGTGTFGRVLLCKNRQTNDYGAMKILRLADVIRLKQVEHVKNEKHILEEISHPFIVNLLWSKKDETCIFMLFEYVCGGELFSYLRNVGRFTTSTSNFYSAEIVSALEYLHSKNIVYRDLKPENLLLDRDGHLKITDFGFAKKLTDRTWTLCGTPEYLAPEIIQSKGHNKAVDWWALGVLIYEMLAGFPPFYDDNPFGIYEKILGGKIEWPKHLDPVAKDLIKKLLVQDRTKRLGNMKSGADDIKRHRWFKGVDWQEVYSRKVVPPFVPKVMYEGDTSNFDDYPESDWKSSRTLEESEQNLFDDF